jgi:hypothetical protein
VSSILPSQIVEITKEVQADGTGNVSFSLGHYRDGDGDRIEKWVHLVGVPEANQLDHEIRRLL